MLSSVTGCFTLGMAPPCWLPFDGRPVGRPGSCCEDTECRRQARDAHRVAGRSVFLVTGHALRRAAVQELRGEPVAWNLRTGRTRTWSHWRLGLVPRVG